jgi:Cu/Ag efflux pump CusA
VVMRYGENAVTVIENVKKKMTDVQKGLPEGVKFKIGYDRTELIRAAVDNVKNKLLDEMLVVSVIVILFLLHWRSALSILIQIPVTIAVSFILLNAFGLSSNIMSLTGIALAIGVIVDNGIIMSENAYRNLSQRQNNPQQNP